MGDLSDEFLEGFIAGDEICFRIDFHHGAVVAVDGNADQAFGGGPASLLCSGGKAFGP